MRRQGFVFWADFWVQLPKKDAKEKRCNTKVKHAHCGAHPLLQEATVSWPKSLIFCCFAGGLLVGFFFAHFFLVGWFFLPIFFGWLFGWLVVVFLSIFCWLVGWLVGWCFFFHFFGWLFGCFFACFFWLVV